MTPCPCSSSPCEMPHLVSEPAHLFESAFPGTNQFDPITIEDPTSAEVLATFVFVYAVAILLLLPLVLGLQRRTSWVLLNLTGLRAAIDDVKTRPIFRLVLSERERRLLKGVSASVDRVLHPRASVPASPLLVPSRARR